jgi:hypothetical protein
MQREVYADIGANQRRYLHARAGEWSGRHGAMASAAFHFEQAGQIDQMVKAGYQAASQAERAGMYHTALMLYQKLRPHVSIEELGPRLAGVLIVLGDWAEAEKLTGLLPVEDSSVRLLRSELAFVRGDFDGALAEAEMALIDNSAERVKVLVRLADIALTSAISAKRSVTDVRLSTWPAPPTLTCAPAVTASWPPPNTSAAASPPPRPGSVTRCNSWRICPKPTATA